MGKILEIPKSQPQAATASIKPMTSEGVVFHFIPPETRVVPGSKQATIHQFPDRPDAETLPFNVSSPATVTSMDSLQRGLLVAPDVQNPYTSQESLMRLVKGVLSEQIAMTERRGRIIIASPDKLSSETMIPFANGDPDGLDFDEL